MKLKPDTAFIALYTIFIFGISLFFLGFFTINYNDEDAGFQPIPDSIDGVRINSSYNRHINSVTLMIVDALRYSFVNEANMPFAASNGCILKLKTNVPTVTMPRIKCLTMGTIPNFIDVILNFGSSAISQDSIIHQMHSRGDKIVFYGDNTWTNLFPGKFHRHGENTDSFFVQDYYEGDKNITKQLPMEYERNDWDAMVLHYLGLDHIGHVEGSFSPKIYKKLNEMDSVIKQMVGATLIKNFNTSHPSIVIVTADHGMRLTGGHGGSTPEEVYVPLITFHNSCPYPTQSIMYNQIDFAATLSVLLGTKIPFSSIGTLIPELLDGLPLEDQLFAFYYNAEHLLGKLVSKYGDSEIASKDYYSNFQKGKHNHKQYLLSNDNRLGLYNEAKHYYLQCSKDMSSELESSLGQFHIDLIIVGIVLSTLSAINLVRLASSPDIHFNHTSIHTMVFGICFSILIQIYICNFTDCNVYACPITIWSLLGFVLFFQICLILIKNILNICFKIQIPVIFSAATIFHALSLSSSSFIEEEHQTWYYFGNTCLLVLSSYKFLTLRSTNIPIRNILKNLNVKTKPTVWLVVFALNIIVRRLNQTGDKWLHLPDLGNWLAMEENPLYLSVFLLLGLCMLILSNWQHNTYFNNVITIMVVLLIYYYRGVTGSLFSPSLKLIDPSTSVKIFWFLVLLLMLKSYTAFVYNRSSRKQNPVSILLQSNYTALTLICGLLHKPYNLVLIPTLTLTLRAVFSAIDSMTISPRKSCILKSVLAVWFGKMFFFYQGNSNSLATIDVNPGFAGLTSYNFLIVGSLTVVNTYSSHLCAYSILLIDIAKGKDFNQITQQFAETFQIMALIILFPVNVYLFYMIIFCEHIFIWTVFSPKFLYEACFAILYYLLFLITTLYFRVLSLLPITL